MELDLQWSPGLQIRTVRSDICIPIVVTVVRIIWGLGEGGCVGSGMGGGIDAEDGGAGSVRQDGEQRVRQEKKTPLKIT